MKPDRELSGYQQFLARRIADGVRRALNNLEPARIGWGAVDVPTQVFNRRWHLKPGTPMPNPFGGQDQVRMNPGRGEPEPARARRPDRPPGLLPRPSGRRTGGPSPCSPTTRCTTSAASPRGTSRPTTSPSSPSDIGRELGADRLDPPFVGIMSNGTSGDVNNINFREKGEPKAPYQKMREVADEVSKAVARAHEKIEFRDGVTLAAARKELVLAVRKPDRGATGLRPADPRPAGGRQAVPRPRAGLRPAGLAVARLAG